MKRFVYFFLILFIACLLRFWNLNWSDVYPDEDHYISDGLRLFNKDPYMSLRYHPLRHPEPSVGHPMFVQLVSNGFYHFVDPSVYSARIPSAVAGLLTVALVFLFYKDLGGRVGRLCALLVSIAPINIRYNRNAMLDSIFALSLTGIALLMWRYLDKKNRIYLLLAGFLAGFALSTKLDGIFGVVLIFSTLYFCTPFRFTKSFLASRLLDTFIILFPVLFVFIIFNDTRAYMDGILHPSFKGWDFTSIDFWKMRLSLNSLVSLFKVSLDLLGPGVVILYIFGIVKVLPVTWGKTAKFLLLWTASVSGVLLVHGFSVDSSYGWLTWIPPVFFTLSYFFYKAQIGARRPLVFIVILSTLPFTFLYGWRLIRVPERGIEYNIVYNRKFDDNFYQDVVSTVNNRAPASARVLLLPQDFYPIFALRKDLSWSYSFSNNYDFYVLNKPVTDKSFFERNEYLGSIVSDQDNLHLERYVYKRQAL